MDGEGRRKAGGHCGRKAVSLSSAPAPDQISPDFFFTCEIGAYEGEGGMGRLLATLMSARSDGNRRKSGGRRNGRGEGRGKWGVGSGKKGEGRGRGVGIGGLGDWGIGEGRVATC